MRDLMHNFVSPGRDDFRVKRTLVIALDRPGWGVPDGLFNFTNKPMQESWSFDCLHLTNRGDLVAESLALLTA
jgi:hypothetical protein